MSSGFEVGEVCGFAIGEMNRSFARREGESMEQMEFIIGIVGGGKGGFRILKLFSKSPLAKIAYVCDLDANAPAVVEARRMHIQTPANLDEALQQKTDFVIEATGSKKVLGMMVEKAGQSNHIISHEMAHFFISVVFDLNRLTNRNVIDDIRVIREGIEGSAGRINQQVRDVYAITRGLHVVGINARVEAARIGQEGLGFDIVAQEVQKSAQKVRVISEEISDISKSILSLSSTVDRSLEKLAADEWGQ
jgi:hypothetical protein